MPAKKMVGRPSKPKSQHKERDYKREYKKFKTSPTAKKKAADRQVNRRAALKSGRIKKGSGKDIHHTASGKTRIMSSSANRGKKEASRVKGSKRNTRNWGK